MDGVAGSTDYGAYGQVVNGGTTSYGVYANVAGATTGYGMYSTVSGGSTQYSGYFTATGGAGDTTYGVYSTVSGGDSNYAFYSPDSGGYSYFGDHVAIEDGTAQDAYTVLSVGEVFSSANLVTGYLTGVSTTASYTGGAINANQILIGEMVEVRWSGGTGTGTQYAYGGAFKSLLTSNNTLEQSVGLYGESFPTDGTMTTSIGVYGVSDEKGSGTITTGYGVYGDSRDAATNYGVTGYAATGTTNYGVYGMAIGGTTDYAGYFADGRVQIEGDDTATAPGWATTDGSLYVNQRMEVDAGAEFDGTGIAIDLSTTVSPNSTYDIRLGSGAQGYVDVYDTGQDTSLAVLNSNASYEANFYIERHLGLGTGAYAGPTTEVVYGKETFTGAGDAYDRYGLRMDVETNIDDSDMNLYGVYSDVTVAGQQVGSLIGTHNEVNLNTYDTIISLKGLRNSVTLDQYGGSTGTNSIYLYGIDSKVLMNNSSSTVDTVYGAHLEVEQGGSAGDTGAVYGSFVELNSKASDPGNWYGYYLTTTNTPAGNKYAFYSNSDGWDALFGANLYIGNGSGADDDYIYFDATSESIKWAETAGEFQISDDVSIAKDLYVGEDSGADDDYVYFDAGVEYLRYDEATSNKFEFSGSLGIGEDSAADDDYIYFDAGAENVMWDESEGEFVISDDSRISGGYLYLDWATIFINEDGPDADAYIRFYDESSQSDEYIMWDNTADNANDRFLFSDNIDTTDTGGDYAEFFTSPEYATLVPGDVLAVDPNNSENVIKSTGTPYDPNVVGVFSEEGGFRIIPHGVDEETAVPVALAGRIEVKMNNENGSILPGDLITSSSIPGEAMKATKPGYTLGKAIESFSGASGTIVIFIEPGWHSGGTIANNGTLSTFKDNFAFDALGTASSSTPAFDSYGLTFRGSGWNAASSTAEALDMTIINSVSSTAEYGLEITNDEGVAVAYVSQDGDFMIGGKLYPSNRGEMQNEKYIFLDTNLSLIHI